MRFSILSAKISLKAIAVSIPVMALLILGCGGGGPDVTAVAPELTGQIGTGQVSMGGAALGGNAATTILSLLKLEEVPSGPLAWVTHRVELAAGDEVTHRHQTAFICSA